MARKDFINDYQKMWDFEMFPKMDFLRKYPDVTFESYDETRRLFHHRKTVLYSMNELMREFSDDERLWLDWKTLGIPDGLEEFDQMNELVDDETYEDMIHEFKVLISAYKD